MFFSVNPYLLLLPIIAVGFLCGMGIYWIAVHRVVGRPQLTSLLSTFAVNMILIGLGTTLWSTSPYNVDFSLPGITIGPYTFTGEHLAAAHGRRSDRRRAAAFPVLHALRQGHSRGSGQSRLRPS